MKENEVKKRNVFVTIWLKTAMLFNIIGFIFYYVSLVVDPLSSGQIRNTGIQSLVCLLSLLACIMLLRWKKNGFYLLVIVAAVSALNDLLGSGMFPAIGIFMLSVGIWYGILQFRKNGISVWKCLVGGFDYKHFRHIYQLTAIFILCVVITCMVVQPVEGSGEIEDDKIELAGSVNKMTSRLDPADLTLKQIQEIENQLKSSKMNFSDRQNADNRIMALKHILLNGIMPEDHTVRSLKNAYLLHKDELSAEQRNVLDWFFHQNTEIQSLWENCEGSSSLADFKKVVLREMKKHRMGM